MQLECQDRLGAYVDLHAETRPLISVLGFLFLHLSLDLLLHDRLLGVEAKHPVEGVNVLKCFIKGATVSVVTSQLLSCSIVLLIFLARAYSPILCRHQSSSEAVTLSAYDLSLLIVRTVSTEFRSSFLKWISS